MVVPGTTGRRSMRWWLLQYKARGRLGWAAERRPRETGDVCRGGRMAEAKRPGGARLLCKWHY